jgi:S-formylglutathione hydrolase FrmB
LLAKELSSPDFCKNNLGSDIALDTDRMICSGQSFGGMSALAAALDDQPYFKAVVTHDPCFFPSFKMIDAGSFDLRHPT